MSARTPVVLVCLPNAPYLLGTFDTSAYKKWWKSKPFCEDIQTITKGFHIYGRSHLAVAKRTDGRWAIYRSQQYGTDWDERVFLGAVGEVIYDIVLITFGWAILNTSLGFYETINAGVTWTKISDLPPAKIQRCALCNIGSDGTSADVLMCTDGHHIWRSTNKAKNWSLVLDVATQCQFAGYEDYPTPVFNYGEDKPSNPCIAGANCRVVASVGPFLLINNAAGVANEWSVWNYWDHWYKVSKQVFPPKEIVHSRIYPGIWPLKFIITQILISSIDGPTGGDVVFLVAYDDLAAMSSDKLLYTRVFKTYDYYESSTGQYYYNQFFKYLYQQVISATHNDQISSYQLPVTGASYEDRLTFAAHSETDSAGNLKVSLKYSPDGGDNFSDIDLSKVKVYDNSDLTGVPESGGPFLDDSFSTITWTHGDCDNVGTWNVVEGKRRQLLSYEQDVNISKESSKSYSVDAIGKAHLSEPEDIDALAEATRPISEHIDANAEGQISKSYKIDRTLEAEVPKSYDIDTIDSLDNTKDEPIDAICEARVKKLYRICPYVSDIVEKGYLLDVFIVKSHINEILKEIERENPQFLDLDLTGAPYSPLDSRKEKL